MSLHIASFNTGKVLGSVLTNAFGVTSTNFTNLAPLVLVSHYSSLQHFLQCLTAKRAPFWKERMWHTCCVGDLMHVGCKCTQFWKHHLQQTQHNSSYSSDGARALRPDGWQSLEKAKSQKHLA